MAVLTAAVSIALLVPLYRSRAGVAGLAGPDSSASEIAIYRDQLEEISRDVQRGVLAPAEAEAARTEISRRLLKADDQIEAVAREPKVNRMVATAAALLLIPALSVGTYLWLGKPAQPDMPLVARMAAQPDPNDPAALVAVLERAVASNPRNPQGWQFLMTIYAQVGRYEDSGRAYLNFVRLSGAEADPGGAMGLDIADAMIQSGGLTERAVDVLKVVQTIDPKNMTARFYLAVNLTETQQTAAALDAWKSLLADIPESASTTPMAEFARARVAELEAAPATPGAPAAGPSQDQIAAAQDLPPEQQQEMIAGMVERLAARLETEPDDANGWAQLIRSYIVLGRTEDAQGALAKARTALAGRADALAAIEAAARATAN